MSGSGLLPCKLTPEPPFRRAKIPAVIAPLQSIIRTAQNLGGGNATARFHQGNCWLGGNLAAFGARAATGQTAAHRVFGCYYAGTCERTGRSLYSAAARIGLDRRPHGKD